METYYDDDDSYDFAIDNRRTPSRRRPYSSLKQPSPEERQRARAVLDDFLGWHEKYEREHEIIERAELQEAERRRCEEATQRARERLEEARQRRVGGGKSAAVAMTPSAEDVDVFKAKIYSILAEMKVENFHATRTQISDAASREDNQPTKDDDGFPHRDGFQKPPSCCLCGSAKHRSYQCSSKDKMFLW